MANVKALLNYMVRELVGDPDAVSVSERVEGDTLILKVAVASGDAGKVIGKQGRLANALRAVVRAAMGHSRRFKRVAIDIVD